VILLRPGGVVGFANAAAERLVGRKLTDRTLADVLSPAHPLAAVASAVLAESAHPRHETVTLPGGTREPRECAVSGYPLRAGGHADGALLVLRDLDPVRAVESLVSYSQKLAALGQLTSGVTHEVKNPLNAMRIHLELLRARLTKTGQPVLPEVVENIDIIAQEIQRLDRVVQGFLRFAHPQALRLAPVDLNATLEDIARVARPEAARAGVEIVLDAGRGLPRVTADAELIAQAIRNLAHNAIQAMPGGGTLTVASRRAASGGVEIRVTDQGVGIPPENLDKIFRLYFTTKAGGSGIGLAMVYRIVQMHDGRVDVESTAGKGTTVVLTLPAVPEAR
jgi:signal transduction histidine kinase